MYRALLRCTDDAVYTLHPTAPISGLYFLNNGVPYLPGDTIPLADIGKFQRDEEGRAQPGQSLVCVTTNINLDCCRPVDGADGNIGDWLFPNGTVLFRISDVLNMANFSRSGFTRQVRLNRHDPEAFSPAGVYKCRVPDSNGDLQVASIILSDVVGISHQALFIISIANGESSQ